jgi:hypothetical protein
MSPLPPQRGDVSPGDPGLPRDARLDQALRHMPDAHMTPSAAVRAAVLREGLKAAEAGAHTASAPASGWRQTMGRWWRSISSGVVGPAALVSVFVVTVAGGLVYRQTDGNADPRLVAKADNAPSGQAQPTAAAPQGQREGAGEAAGEAGSLAAADQPAVVAAAPSPQRVAKARSPAPASLSAPTAPVVADLPAAAPAPAPSRSEAALASVAAKNTATQAEGRLAKAAPPTSERPAAAAANSTPTSTSTSDAALVGVAVTLNSRSVVVAPARAAALLAALRQWQHGALVELPVAEDSGTGDRGALQLPGGESWSWAAGRLRYRPSPATASQQQWHLSPAQQADLDQLALQAMAP